MSMPGRAAAWISLVVALGVASTGCATCMSDVLLTPSKRALNSLKNRTASPTPADIDPRVTLDTMLAPGDDRTRWQDARAGSIEGFVIRVHDAGAESANCFSPTRRDAHIEIARRVDAPPRERVVVEVTPRLRDLARQRGLDWSTDALANAITGRRVRIEGWLLFDSEHAGESENIRPGAVENWRATAWEIHPVTAIAVIDSPRE